MGLAGQTFYTCQYIYMYTYLLFLVEGVSLHVGEQLHGEILKQELLRVLRHRPRTFFVGLPGSISQKLQ